MTVASPVSGATLSIEQVMAKGVIPVSELVEAAKVVLPKSERLAEVQADHPRNDVSYSSIKLGALAALGAVKVDSLIARFNPVVSQSDTTLIAEEPVEFIKSSIEILVEK